MEKFNFVAVADGSFEGLVARFKELSDAGLKLAIVSGGVATSHASALLSPAEHFVKIEPSGAVIYDVDPSQFQPILEMLDLPSIVNVRGFFTKEMIETALRRDVVDNAVADGSVLSVEDGVHRHGFRRDDMEWAAERHAALLNR